LIKLTGPSGLRQAIFILQCIHEGKTQNELIKMCDDNKQLVDLWTELMTELKWLEKKRATSEPAIATTTESVALTEAGEETMKRYFYSQKDTVTAITAGTAQKDIQVRPVILDRLKIPTRCAACSAVATLELVTELDDIMTVEKICDACFTACEC
jgi:hypothetical protein